MRDFFGLALIVVQVCLLIPLFIHVIRAKSGSGQSLIGESIWVAGGLGWLVYGWATGSVVLMISGSIAMIGSLVFSLLLWNLMPHEKKKSAVYFSIVAGIFVVAFTLFEIKGLIIALSIFGVLQFIPQLIAAYPLVFSDKDASGVSVMGSGLRSAYTLGWTVYAGAWFIWGMKVADVDLPLLLWGATGVVAFGLQFIGVLRSRTRTHAVVSEPQLVL